MLVAVFNLGEGEWYEIQKRIDFSSSNQTKTPNQVALRWKQIKRVMKRDIKQVKKETNFSKIITKHEWIIQTLSTMAKQDPSGIPVTKAHLDVLAKSL